MGHNDLQRTKIILVRHGECQGNREDLFRGRSDFPLNKEGFNQARELAKELKSFQPIKIFTSPLIRARQTAEAISQECNIQVEERYGMNNIELGSWEGKSKLYIAEKYPEQWQVWLKEPEKLSFPGMESLDKVQARSRKDLDDIIKEFSGKTVIIVSHRAVLKPLIASCIGIKKPYFWRVHVDTASYSVIHYEKRRGFSLIQLNQTKHLTEFISEWQ
ncbi:MAG: histidine phosphatase family protein [Candidatus Atribacteria bacterium]|nr:histidine phosphatase family protein [Candidatus Atribacteria bacterium]